MKNKNLALVILFVGAIFLPWWFVSALLVGAFLFYQDFFGGIAVLFFMDIIYGTGLSSVFNHFVFTLSGLILFVVVEFCRKNLFVHEA